MTAAPLLTLWGQTLNQMSKEMRAMQLMHFICFTVGCTLLGVLNTGHGWGGWGTAAGKWHLLDATVSCMPQSVYTRLITSEIINKRVYLGYFLSVSAVHMIKNVWKPLYVQIDCDAFLLCCNILREPRLSVRYEPCSWWHHGFA